ncbi:MAG: HD domain-containing protein [Solirubrobacterales bacterium]
MNDELTVKISELLAPWASKLGDDRVPYTNHVTRVLLLCNELAPASAERPSERDEFLAAGVFHDLGIWSDGTFDYLAPSIDLARDWLTDRGQSESIERVSAMIDQHHKVRTAGEADDPVEIFRRADTIDVLLGARRFGVPYRRYRAIRKAYPDRGFHRRLVQLGTRRLIEHPASPLPMFRW